MPGPLNGAYDPIFADFTDKTIAMTGATSGMARATLHSAAADEGVRMLLHACDETALRGLAQDLNSRGAATEIILCDPAIEAFRIAATVAARNNIDVLIIAGRQDPPGDILTAPPLAARAAFDANALLALHMMQAMLPEMMRRGYGRVVTISSADPPRQDARGQTRAAGAVSLAALNAVTRLAANDVHGDVKVNALHVAAPGAAELSAPSGRHEDVQAALWLASLPADGPNGGFFHERTRIPW